MNAQAGGESASAAAEPVATPGELLRRERERRGLSVQQAGEDLHLDPVTIQAIEANRFQALGAPVYAKGHLRKYAMLLGLAPGPLLELYQALSDTPVVPTPVPATVSSSGLEQRVSWKVPLWIAGGIAVLGLGWRIVGALLAPTAPDAIPTQPAVLPASEPQHTSAPAAEGATPSVEIERSSASAAEPQRGVAAPVVASSSTPPSPAATAATIQLRLEFSEASWVEVYDAGGTRLLFDMGLPERVRTIAGVAPLQVTLGRASAVSAQVNDQAIVIPRLANRDATKFAILADGSISQ
jgi:cytoskeleton protein RodZ